MKYLNKELVVTKEDKHFENFTKCWICNDTFVERNVKVIDHCQASGNHRRTAHRDCNISFSLNYKIPIVFHNLKSFDAQSQKL